MFEVRRTKTSKTSFVSAKSIVWYSQGGNVVNATFLCFETSKLWVLICIFVDRWKAEGLRQSVCYGNRSSPTQSKPLYQKGSIVHRTLKFNIFNYHLQYGNFSLLVKVFMYILDHVETSLVKSPFWVIAITLLFIDPVCANWYILVNAFIRRPAHCGPVRCKIHAGCVFNKVHGVR